MAKKLSVMAVVCVSVLALTVVGCTPPPAASLYVNPCSTQAAITCDSVTGHIASVPLGGAQNRLAIVLPGTGATPSAYQKLTTALSYAGFHVIGLRYNTGVGTNSACPDANAVTDPDCHRAFKAEVAFGAGVNDPSGHAYDSPAVNVSAANSVENRILQLVNYLANNYATSGWSQYQKKTGLTCDSLNTTYGVCDVDWSKVVLVGHSLGAGEALYLAKFHDVNRLAMISGPFDEYLSPSLVVAPWITEGGFATPASSMYGLTQLLEPNYPNQSAAWDALGLAGPQVSVDSDTPPYSGSHQLTTNVTPSCSTSGARHNSTAQDLCTPGSPVPSLQQAWQFLAGA